MPSEQYKVLIVEDDKLLSQIVATHLQEDDFIIIPAYSLQEARHYIANDSEIDLVLLDYHLGDGDGIDFLKYNAVVPYLDKAPVIITSVDDDTEFLEACFQHGASDYLIKPVNFKLLSLKARSLVQSAKLKNVINKQNEALSKYKNDSLREEAIAKFTYEYLVRQVAEQVPGVSIWLQPSSAFSGDAILVKTSPSGDLFMIVADATGHGLSAAITIMPLVTTFHSMVSKGFHLQSIMAEINKKLVDHTPDDRFVAAVGIEINKASKELSVWNGGMPSAFIINDEGIAHRFKSRHLALGILDDESFDASLEEMTLAPGSRFFSCSDGLLEQLNSRGEPFSKKRLIDVLQGNPADLLGSVIHSFDAHIENTSHTDDISMCLVDLDQYFSAHNHQQIELRTTGKQDHGKFAWNMKIDGARLATAEIIPLVQHLVQQMEVGQALSQKVFIVVSEMLNNAIDHGVLELSSELKEQDNGFLLYQKERERRLTTINPDSYVSLSLEYECKNGLNEILVRVKDSGKGYVYEGDNPGAEPRSSGRGLALIHKLSRYVRIESPGNMIEALLV